MRPASLAFRLRRRLLDGPPPELDLADIQGNILRGYRCPTTTYVFLSVVDAEPARAWLAELADQLTTAERRPSGLALNLAVTATGLARLGVDPARLSRLPRAFLQGMAARAAELGDEVHDVDGTPVSEGWHPPFVPGGLVHLMLMASGDAGRVAEAVDDLRGGLWQCGVMVVDTLTGTRLPGEREHFGFRDGISQPAVEGVHDAADAGSGRARGGSYHPVRAGEFVIGLPGEDGVVVEDVPSLTRHGSYLVLRKLEQDVASFERHVEEAAHQTGLAPGLVRAKLMGRWPDGAPLSLHPEPPEPGPADGDNGLDMENGFDFADDLAGARCPIGAHIRRANPRGTLEFDGALEHRHRVIRRGIPYGPPYRPEGRPDEHDDAERGLIFVSYQADIADQFEFVQQQWLGDGNVFALGADRDPVVADPRGGSGLMRLEGLPAGDDGSPAVPPVFVDALARCVTSRGGEYFLVPSISAVRRLGRMRVVEVGR